MLDWSECAALLMQKNILHMNTICTLTASWERKHQHNDLNSLNPTRILSDYNKAGAQCIHPRHLLEHQPQATCNESTQQSNSYDEECYWHQLRTHIFQ